MAKKVIEDELPPELLYKLKYENKEFYRLKDKLLEHKHFLGGYIFMDNQLAIQMEYEVERYGLIPNNEKITDFLYSHHEAISFLIEDIIGDYLEELLMYIGEEFVRENIDELRQILEANNSTDLSVSDDNSDISNLLIQSKINKSSRYKLFDRLMKVFNNLINK